MTCVCVFKSRFNPNKTTEKTEKAQKKLKNHQARRNQGEDPPETEIKKDLQKQNPPRGATKGSNSIPKADLCNRKGHTGPPKVHHPRIESRRQPTQAGRAISNTCPLGAEVSTPMSTLPGCLERKAHQRNQSSNQNRANLIETSPPHLRKHTLHTDLASLFHRSILLEKH